MCTEHQKLAVEVENLRKGLADAQRSNMRLAGELAEAEAGTKLVRAMRAVLGGGTGGAAIDEDAIVQRVLARVPVGAGAITVTPPAKLRADFQQAEVARLLGDIGALKPLAKTVLKLLEAVEGASLFQKAIAERLGRSTGGGSWIDLTTQVKELAGSGFVEIDQKRGVRTVLRTKIAVDLTTYQATDADVEATYQAVLHAIATEE
jgi:hypothetical protein